MGFFDVYNIFNTNAEQTVTTSSGATILGVQTALVAGLLVQSARRRRTEFALRESERRYRAKAEENQDLAAA